MSLELSRRVAIVGLALLALTEPLYGQKRSDRMLPVGGASSVHAGLAAPRLTLSTESQPANDVTLVLAGIAGATVGSFGGAFLGYQLDRNGGNWGCGHGCENPGLLGLVGGWFVGPALTTPLSVHLANGGRGSLGSAYLSSALIAGVGMAGLTVAGSPEGAFILLAAPVAQAVSAVLIERSGPR
jgi:hypothetical protein